MCLSNVVLKHLRQMTCDLYKENAMNKKILKWSYSVINLSHLKWQLLKSFTMLMRTEWCQTLTTDPAIPGRPRSPLVPGRPKIPGEPRIP